MSPPFPFIAARLKPSRFPTISSPIDDFLDELHRRFLEGLAATGIRDIRDGTREDIPLKDWLDHVPTLAGEVLTRKSFPRDYVSSGLDRPQDASYHGVNDAAAITFGQGGLTTSIGDEGFS